MPSPFPGMDPYIEAIDEWEDFHTDLCAKIKDSLADQLPKGYFVRLARRSYVVLADEDGKQTRPFIPDVKVTSGSQPSAGRQATATLAEPVTAKRAMTIEIKITDEFRESFIEIYEKRDYEALVTSIEVLSPSNKRPGTEGYRQFQRKRQAVLASEANLVEIDLLRQGTRPPMRSEWPKGPYTLLVCRGSEVPQCDVQTGHYRVRLPEIPIPLRAGDAELRLDLQPMIDAIYARSRYDELINYAKPLDPPLPEDDTAWFAEALQAWIKNKQTRA